MTAHMRCYLRKLHSINSVVLHNHMLKTFFSLIRHHWFSTLIQEQKNYITIYHLPSALCCSPIRSMRFLLSLLFSLMVYPPNSNTLPTTWGGKLYRNYIYFARYFLFLYRACHINKLLEYLTFNKYLISYHKYVILCWVVRHQFTKIFLSNVEVLNFRFNVPEVQYFESLHIFFIPFIQ